MEKQKIIINSDNLIADDTWQFFRKVRAIVENAKGEIIITNEGGKVIFPGGKCDPEEPEHVAIQREIMEETGIDLPQESFKDLFEIECYYPKFYDHRTDKYRPRHMQTTYYYVKTDKPISYDKLNLTDYEISENFNTKFVSKEQLEKLVKEDHSHLEGGKFFDEENIIALNYLKENNLF